MDPTAVIIAFAPWIGVVASIIAGVTRFNKVESKVSALEEWRKELVIEHKSLEQDRTIIRTEVSALKEAATKNDIRFEGIERRLTSIEHLLVKICTKLDIDGKE